MVVTLRQQVDKLRQGLGPMALHFPAESHSIPQEQVEEGTNSERSSQESTVGSQRPYGV